MHRLNLLFVLLIFLFFFGSCLEDDPIELDLYPCDLVANMTTDHPLGVDLQEVLNNYNRTAFVGASLTVRDDNGLWQGAAGKADVVADIDMKVCNSFLIASISKVFTASLIFLLIEEELLKLDTLVSNFLSDEIKENVANVTEATFRDLLAHTSGIPDYYTDEFDEKRYTVQNNNWQQEDILKFTYDLPAINEVGQTYAYSNTNYLLLGIIAENITGETLEELYNEKIFSPLQLYSAYYSVTNPISQAVVQGYIDGDGDGVYRNSLSFYQDELKTADGGIAINGQDLQKFFQSLRNGKLINDSSLLLMQSWFDLPEESQGLFQTKNGLGLEYYENETGSFYGHTGGIDGFLSFMFYYPEQDLDIVLLLNSASANGEPLLSMYQDLMTVIFQ